MRRRELVAYKPEARANRECRKRDSIAQNARQHTVPWRYERLLTDHVCRCKWGEFCHAARI